jgi:hypothetical protein
MIFQENDNNYLGHQKMKRPRLNNMALLMIVTVVAWTSSSSFVARTVFFVDGFTIAPRVSVGPRRSYVTTVFALPDIGGMKIGEIRKELESYGISTKSFLEKKEMIAALERARAEGKTPVNGASSSSSKTAGGSGGGGAASGSTESRSDRIREEMERAKSMSVADLKKALQSLGVSTRSFFEKSEFVQAYAEAVVDSVEKQTSSAAPGEVFDPEYRDVVTQKLPKGDNRMLQGKVIDITIKR